MSGCNFNKVLMSASSADTLSAVKGSEAESGSNCWELPVSSSGTQHVGPSQDEAVVIPELGLVAWQ